MRCWRSTTRLGHGRRLQPGARFRAGSITKTFVATVVLQLVAEGRLDLDDRVTDLLPGPLDPLPGADAVTVRMLLQHTSGIDDALAYVPIFGEEWVAMRFHHYRPEELVGLAAAQPLLFEPGTGWAYSNTNYVIAGMIIEQITGRSWRSEVMRRLLRPLKLRDTFLPDRATGIPGPNAHAYMALPDRQRPVDITRQSMSWAGAAGEMISTASDLNRFSAAAVPRAHGRGLNRATARSSARARGPVG